MPTTFNWLNSPAEFDWEEYYANLETYLAPEDRVQFWRCHHCQAVNALVVGEPKGRCTECGLQIPVQWMDPVNTPVL